MWLVQDPDMPKWAANGIDAIVDDLWVGLPTAHVCDLAYVLLRSA